MSLRDDPRIQQFENQINEQVLELMDFICEGKCISYDDYKKRTGIIKGMKDSKLIMIDVLKKYGTETDDGE